MSEQPVPPPPPVPISARSAGHATARVKAQAEREQAIRDALMLTTEQINRLRLLLRVFCLGTGLVYLSISGVYVVFTERLYGIASYRVLLDAMPPWGWAMLFLASGLSMILAGTFCASWRRATITAAAALAFWQGTAYAYAPIVNAEASPMLAVLFLTLAFYMVLGAMFARVQQVAHEADTTVGEIETAEAAEVAEASADAAADAADAAGPAAKPPAPE
jgi:hypothetical protein